MTIGKRRRLHVRVWCALALLCLLVALFPIQTGITRSVVVFGSFGAWALGLFFFWRLLVCRVIFLLPIAGVVMLALMPYRIADVPSLRAAYIQALRRYEGVRYLEGGEGWLGIDGSGLVRHGLIDASLSEGWRTKDLSLLRTGAALWWYDASVKVIGEGYQGRIRNITTTASLNTLDETPILPGDLAVTEDGQHILAFLGEHTWIEADPKSGKVIVVSSPSKDPWFEMPLRIVRWYRL